MSLQATLLLFLLLLGTVTAVTVVGNSILTNGNCIYVDGEIRENGNTRKATQQDEDQVIEYKRGMDEWAGLFSQWMNDKMSNMFNPDYVPPPQPVAPQIPCLCNLSSCGKYTN